MKRNGQRILLVDDYPEALKIWSASLAALGYDVMTATNGNEAVRLATSERPHLIVLDIDLPGITGSEAARRLRSTPATASIPLIAATGTSYAPSLEEARHAGFDVILLKPCETTDLVEEIERLLNTESPSSTDGHPRA